MRACDGADGPIALFYYQNKSEQLKANQIWEFCYSNDGETKKGRNSKWYKDIAKLIKTYSKYVFRLTFIPVQSTDSSSRLITWKGRQRLTFDSLTPIIYIFMLAKHLYFDWLGWTTWTEEILRSKKYPAHRARG